MEQGVGSGIRHATLNNGSQKSMPILNSSGPLEFERFLNGFSPSDQVHSGPQIQRMRGRPGEFHACRPLVRRRNGWPNCHFGSHTRHQQDEKYSTGGDGSGRRDPMEKDSSGPGRRRFFLTQTRQNPLLEKRWQDRSRRHRGGGESTRSVLFRLEGTAAGVAPCQVAAEQCGHSFGSLDPEGADHGKETTGFHGGDGVCGFTGIDDLVPDTPRFSRRRARSNRARCNRTRTCREVRCRTRAVSWMDMPSA